MEIRRHSAKTPWTYALLEERQREVAHRVHEGGPGALLLSELAPVITLGRRAEEARELRLSREVLTRRGIEVLKTARGGLATWHGPGQWVIFAVDRLDRLTGDRRGVRLAVQGLLSAALRVCQSLCPEATIRDGSETGVWSPRGKLAAIGVQIEKGILLHGISVNGYRSETSFVGLRPCGLDAQADFLLADAGGFERLGEKILQEVSASFLIGSALDPKHGQNVSDVYRRPPL